MKLLLSAAALLGGYFLLTTGASARPSPRGGGAGGKGIGPDSKVRGASGQTWNVRMVAIDGDVKTFQVFTGRKLLLTYQQTGSDRSSRSILSVNESASGTTVRKALSDFGLIPGTVAPAAPTSTKKLPRFKVKGKSGKIYTIVFYNHEKGRAGTSGIKFYSVYRGSRHLINYQQGGHNTSDRQLVSVQKGANAAMVATAKADFLGTAPLKAAQPVPVAISSDRQVKVEDGRYAANVNLGWAKAAFATPKIVAEEIDGAGFTSAVATDKRPSNWPIQADADWYIVADWNQGPKTFNAPDEFKKISKVSSTFKPA